jgi:hypothetical protein
MKARMTMNLNETILGNDLADDGRFATVFAPTAPFRGTAERELDELKNRLLRLELARTVSVDANVLLRRAANEAAALAWLTPYPTLVLPGLFEELARTARVSGARQGGIRARTPRFMALAE